MQLNRSGAFTGRAKVAPATLLALRHHALRHHAISSVITGRARIGPVTLLERLHRRGGRSHPESVAALVAPSPRAALVAPSLPADCSSSWLATVAPATPTLRVYARQRWSRRPIAPGGTATSSPARRPLPSTLDHSVEDCCTIAGSCSMSLRLLMRLDETLD